MGGLTLDLPTGYYLERDPDVLTLRRTDGSVVAAFSALGATPSAVRQAAEQAGAGSTAPSNSVPESRYPRAASPAARLRVWFFGNFELSGESGTILQPSRGSRAISVLKYLLAHEGRPVSQDFLMGWLWPESDLKRARWSLNSTIYALRKLLTEAVSSTDSQSHVLLEEGCYRLYPDLQVTSDVQQFDACYERGRLAEKTGRMQEAVAEYENAVELYRGDYLVEDLYEDWTMVERERLADAYVDMLDRLADRYAETGRVRAAIRTCHRILEKDPCHEHTHRRLMRHYVRLGLHGRALNQYELCRKILRHTCEMPPSPETKALHDTLFPGSSS